MLYFYYVVLIGNKSDLGERRVVNETSAQQLAESLGIKYFETSAKTGDNVNESVDALLEQVITYFLTVDRL